MERESKAGRRLERYRRGRDFLKIEEAKKGVFDDVISELTILSGLYSDILDTYSEDEWWTIFVVLEELQGEILGYIKVDDGVRDRLEGILDGIRARGRYSPMGEWIDEIMEHLYSIREKFDQVVYELDNVIDRGEKRERYMAGETRD